MIPRATKLLVLAAISALAALVPNEATAALAPEPEPEKPPEPPEPPRAKAAQAPSVGRVVHFHFHDEGGNVVTRPALIVRTWDPAKYAAYQNDQVNLRVFLDGANDNQGTGGPADWQTSIPRSDEPKAGCWSWPPHVPAAR